MLLISLAVVFGRFVGAGYIPPGEACGCREVPREGYIPPLQTKGKIVVIPKPGNHPRPVRGVEDAAPYNEKAQAIPHRDRGIGDRRSLIFNPLLAFWGCLWPPKKGSRALALVVPRASKVAASFCHSFHAERVGPPQGGLPRGHHPQINRHPRRGLPERERKKERKKETAPSQLSESNFKTAVNASLGKVTLPSWRIFFLPAFCFSSSFFLRVMSPP